MVSNEDLRDIIEKLSCSFFNKKEIRTVEKWSIKNFHNEEDELSLEKQKERNTKSLTYFRKNNYVIEVILAIIILFLIYTLKNLISYINKQE